MSNDHTLHAPLPPSSASRWTKCPGSIPLSQKVRNKYGEEPSNPAAEKGTWLHDRSADVWEGRMALADIEDEDDRDLIAGYLGQVSEYQKLFSTEPRIEVKVQAPRWCHDIWGTVDAVFPSDETMVILDLKTGYVPVVAYENLQLLSYAALAREHFKVSPKTIILAIYQPNARDGLGTLREWELTGQELDRFAAEIKHAANIALSPQGALIFNPGVEQCQWCPAAGHCAAQARSEAVLDFLEDRPEVDLLSSEELGLLLDKVPLVDKFISQLRAAGLQRAMSQEQIPGWRVVTAKTQRRWSDPKQVEAILRKAKLPEESFMDSKLKSFTKILKVKEMAALVKDFIVKPEGGPVLGDINDPRPDYNPASEYEAADRETE